MAEAGCHTTTADEDLQQLSALEANPPRAVLICSDLHLGPGYDPKSGQVARAENFVQDGPFSRFLEHHIEELAKAADDGPALLIINGDIVDFPRITNIPTTDEDFERWRQVLLDIGYDKSVADLKQSIVKKERKFGLKTNDYKVTWKFDHVVRGHPVFFEALAQWVAAGHHLVYAKGNHDVEIEHPLVRRAFRAALVRAGADPDGVHARVGFCMDGLRLANAWIEHGHQFEDMTKVVGPAFLDTGKSAPKPDELELNQPLGTFVNRYLLNPIENVRPFLNNIKPVQGVLWKLIRHHPIKSLGIVYGASVFVPRAIAMARFRMLLSYLLFILFFLGGWVVGVGIILLLAGLASGGLDHFADRAVQWTAIAVLAGVTVPVLVGAVRELIDRIQNRHVSKYVRDCVAAAPDDLNKQGFAQTYVIVGHTHEQDSQRFEWEPNTDSPTMYLNTGTWIPLWDDDRPDLHGKTLRPFVRLDLMQVNDKAEYRHAHLQWNDGRGVPEPSVVFSSAPL